MAFGAGPRQRPAFPAACPLEIQLIKTIRTVDAIINPALP